MNFQNETILITGGTGSFGNALVRRMLNSDVKEIRIFSRDEKKQDDMRRLYGNPKITFYIGDVRNNRSVNDAMAGIDYVFHAAALKQVPSCEFYPMEALMTNSVGTDNVLSAAIANGVKRVVVLSTDKAVYPINAMGLSKAMMEKIMVAKSRVASAKGTILCGTRYGNVMASRGSVIPLFIEQILSGQPITITDGSMTRFMMSLDEAIKLVIFAFENAEQGDIFVKKAPSATVEDLAIALKKILNADNPIRVIGTRHGEKLYETLLSREEMVRSDDMGDYYRIRADGRDLNYEKYFSDGDANISTVIDYNSHNINRISADELIRLLLSVSDIQEILPQTVNRAQ